MQPSREPEDPVPVFGSWPRIYAAVIISALLVMALIGIFSAARY